MKKIFKYPLRAQDIQAVIMPLGSKILSIGTQFVEGSEALFVWAMVDPVEESMESKDIRIVGTGHIIMDPDEWSFIGTAMMMGGRLVWHIFERRK